MGIDDEILAIEKNIGDAIEQAMRTVILDLVKDTMIMAIESTVYEAYNPTQYNRAKGAGGLTDKHNIDIESYDRSETEHVMKVKNYRSDFGSGGGRDVAEIVNKGTGYSWVNSEIYQAQPYPRQFYLETDRLLESDGGLDSFLETALSRF